MKAIRQPLDGARCVMHRHVLTPAGDVHLVEAGEGAPLLMIHGGHGAWQHWCANLDALAPHAHAMALDLPGFGDSYDPGRLLMPDEQAGNVAAMLDALGLKRITLAGFSFGTLVSVNLALQRPELVASLLLVSPPGVGPRSPEALALPAKLGAIAREQGRHAGMAATLRELMLHDPALVDDALIEQMEAVSRRTRYVTRSVSRGSDMLAMLQRLQIPTTVLLGEHDPYHSNDLAGRCQSIDRALGRPGTHVVPGAAHWVPYDQPEAFHRSVLLSLQRAAS